MHRRERPPSLTVAFVSDKLLIYLSQFVYYKFLYYFFHTSNASVSMNLPFHIFFVRSSICPSSFKSLWTNTISCGSPSLKLVFPSSFFPLGDHCIRFLAIYNMAFVLQDDIGALYYNTMFLTILLKSHLFVSLFKFLLHIKPYKAFIAGFPIASTFNIYFLQLQFDLIVVLKYLKVSHLNTLWCNIIISLPKFYDIYFDLLVRNSIVFPPLPIFSKL